MKDLIHTDKPSIISLKEWGSTLPAEERQDYRMAALLKKIPQGIEVLLPNRIEIPNIDIPDAFFKRRFMGRGALLVVFGLISLLPLWFLYSVRGILDHPSEFIGTAGIGVCIFWCTTLYVLFETEKIVLSGECMSIHTMLLGITIRKSDYDIRRMRNLRLGANKRTNRLQFEYAMDGNGQQTIGCCPHLKDAFAEPLLQMLRTMLRFHIHSISCIIFGKIAMMTTDTTRLYNPDIVDLVIPFVHLQQIIIHTAHYDFYQVERFLTYAVNVIGRDQLKNEVDVHVYGDPKQLHPNLRNNFMNLCHRVYIHETENMVN